MFIVVVNIVSKYLLPAHAYMCKHYYMALFV